MIPPVSVSRGVFVYDQGVQPIGLQWLGSPDGVLSTVLAFSDSLGGYKSSACRKITSMVEICQIKRP